MKLEKTSDATTPLTGYERLKRSREKKIREGLIRIEIWVKPENADRVRRFAKKVENENGS